jgi:hypothetical protein
VCIAHSFAVVNPERAAVLAEALGVLLAAHFSNETPSRRPAAWSSSNWATIRDAMRTLQY